MTSRKNELNLSLKKLFIGIFLILSSLVSCFAVVNHTVYAEPENGSGSTQQNTTENSEVQEEGATEESREQQDDNPNKINTDNCKNSLGALAWLVCPTTGKIAEAVDWLYDKIEDLLIINPVAAEDGSPIYEIWKYIRGLTNILFIVFLLVMIYSQITGVGISNYGLKKALPKLIVAIVLVNISFLICSVLVDVSNIVGSGFRGLFSAIAESAVPASEAATATGDLTVEQKMSYASMYSSLAGGTALTIGGAAIAFETGAIWMLIPLVLGAIVAVVSGLITIAMRQAVVALLMMISPMAILANTLPNTEGLFKKWKDLLTKMLVFYPMFSLLFGASNLAGFAIITSASDGFGVLIGMAVQIFPLFFSWSLMKMSGTFLNTINTKMRGLTRGALATNRAWADSHRQLTKQRHLAAGNTYTPSAKLMQFLANRRISREAGISAQSDIVKNRGLAYHAGLHYRRNGTISRRGEKDYADESRKMRYQQIVMRDKNNYEEGLGGLKDSSNSVLQRARLRDLDVENLNATDNLFAENARSEIIEYDNAKGRHQRFEDAINIHMDDTNGYRINPNTGKKEPRPDYRFHFSDDKSKAEARARYSVLNRTMNGSEFGAHYAAAAAAQGYDTQKKITETRMQKYFEAVPSTKDVENRLNELTKKPDAANNIDSIISGMRVLNQRGDTDVLRRQVENVLNSKSGVDLGSHASQSLASFLMFEVKDNDPFLRRFGKYINLETAQVYNSGNKRQNKRLSLDEYITGEYEDWAPGDMTNRRVGKSKKSIIALMEGTPLDNVERTAYANLDQMLMNTYTKDGQLDVKKYLKKREEIDKATGPAFISASLKYLSGSEQLKSAVSYLTGYNGDTPVWEDAKSPLFNSEEAEKYFRRRTLDYIKGQTPVQALGLRSDYYPALLKHFVNEYKETDMKGWSEDAKKEREDIMNEWEKLQDKYGDSPVGEERANYDSEVKKLENKMAGAEFRQILDSKGKLNQIYRTRRSGAANNAKDWVRDWLNLDNEMAINEYLEVARKEEKRKWSDEKRKKGEADSEEGSFKVGGYTEGDRLSFISEIDSLWANVGDEGSENFFEKSRKKLQDWFGKSSFMMWLYDRYHEDNPTADDLELKDYLCDLLAEEKNYPDV